MSNQNSTPNANNKNIVDSKAELSDLIKRKLEVAVISFYLIHLPKNSLKIPNYFQRNNLQILKNKYIFLKDLI